MKVGKVLAIFFEVIGIVLATLGLYGGINSIGADYMGQLGVIFIFPSIVALVIILFDLFITTGVIKKGMIYSIISTVLKVLIIISMISPTIYDIEQELKGNLSNLSFDMILTGSLLALAFASFMNILITVNRKKQATKKKKVSKKKK